MRVCVMDVSTRITVNPRIFPKVGRVGVQKISSDFPLPSCMYIYMPGGIFQHYYSSPSLNIRIEFQESSSVSFKEGERDLAEQVAVLLCMYCHVTSEFGLGKWMMSRYDPYTAVCTVNLHFPREINFNPRFHADCRTYSTIICSPLGQYLSQGRFILH